MGGTKCPHCGKGIYITTSNKTPLRAFKTKEEMFKIINKELEE